MTSKVVLGNANIEANKDTNFSLYEDHFQKICGKVSCFLKIYQNFFDNLDLRVINKFCPCRYIDLLGSSKPGFSCKKKNNIDANLIISLIQVFIILAVMHIFT